METRGATLHNSPPTSDLIYASAPGSNDTPAQLRPAFAAEVLDGMPTPLIVVDETGAILYGNSAIIELSGRQLHEALGHNIIEYVHPDDQQWIAETFLALIAETRDPDVWDTNPNWNAIQFLMVAKDGTAIPIEVTGRVALGNPAVRGVALALRDARLDRRLATILHGLGGGTTSDRLLATLAAAVEDPPLALTATIIETGGNAPAARAVHGNRELASLLQQNPQLADAFPVDGTVTRLPVDDVAMIADELRQLGAEELFFVATPSPDGRRMVTLLATSPRYVSAIRSSLHRLEWASDLINLILLKEHNDHLLSTAASHDPLTGLPNRRGLRLFLDHLRNPEQAAVMFVDLDGFKAINDRHGHQVGDRVLEVVASRLRHAVRLDDHLCRLGGDEFAIVLTAHNGAVSLADAERVAHRLVTALAAPIELRDATVAVGASVGVAMPSECSTIEDLLTDADNAMYRAKRSGGGKYLVRPSNPDR